MRWSRSDLLELAARMGHSGFEVYLTDGERIFTQCGCGWKSTTRVTLSDALSGLRYHAMTESRQLVMKAESTGRPIDELVAEYMLRPHHWRDSRAVGKLISVPISA